MVAATMIELLHTATLLHDDVVDKAHSRRGFVSIHNIWNNKAAILLGDFLLSKVLFSFSDVNKRKTKFIDKQRRHTIFFSKKFLIF